MSAIRNWLLGKHTTVIDIKPCTVNAGTGAITVGTAASLRGRANSIRIRHRANTEMIVSVDDVVENHVVLMDGYVVELSEILTVKTGTSYQPVLPVMFYTADLFQVTFTRGGKTTVVYGVRSEMDDGITGQGKQDASLTLLPVNVNVDNSGTASIAYGDAA